MVYAAVLLLIKSVCQCDKLYNFLVSNGLDYFAYSAFPVLANPPTIILYVTKVSSMLSSLIFLTQDNASSMSLPTA